MKSLYAVLQNYEDKAKRRRGGSRERVQGVRTLPWDDLRFSNTIGILQKKKNYVV